MKKLQGFPGSEGKALGRVVCFGEEKKEVIKREISNPEEQIAMFRLIQKEYGEELTSLYHETQDSMGQEPAEIFNAYYMILNDEEFFGNCIKRCLEEKINLDFIIWEEQNKVHELFQTFDDEYMRERSSDITNVCHKVILRLNGRTEDQSVSVDEDFIVAADDLSPEDTIRLDKRYLKGLITENGGVTSHTVILAKTLGIPAVVGVSGLLEAAGEAGQIYLDGDTGEVYIDPIEEVIHLYHSADIKMKEKKALYEQFAAKKAVTLDGIHAAVCINSGDKDSMEMFRAEYCDGIGLFRTEFVYMGEEDYPPEDKQFNIYKRAAEMAEGREVTIRTLDIGGDKKLDYMGLEKEDNPFLGYRAIRICLDRSQMFLTQLRAILRASAYGYVRIMFPMIVNLTEFRQAKEYVLEAMRQLETEGIPYDSNIEVGIMIETPAAVMICEKLAKEADFFSIGTNDLTQYITASDRMNEKIQYLYNTCNVAVLRAIKQTIDGGHKHGRKVGMCGEAASDIRLIPLWIGFGLDEFSVAPSLVGKVKYIISKQSSENCRQLAREILDADTERDVELLLDQWKGKYSYE